MSNDKENVVVEINEKNSEINEVNLIMMMKSVKMKLMTFKIMI